MLETEGLCLMQPVSHLLTDELTKCPKCYPSVLVFPTCSKTKNIHLELKLTSSLGLTFIDRNKTKQLNLQQTKEQQQQQALNISLLKPSPGYCPRAKFFSNSDFIWPMTVIFFPHVQPLYLFIYQATTCLENLKNLCKNHVGSCEVIYPTLCIKARQLP